jgi:tight adherence protein B
MIIVAVFVGVTALVGGMLTLFRVGSSDTVEERLDVLAGLKKDVRQKKGGNDATLLAGPLDEVPGLLEQFFSRVANIRLILDQADVSIPPAKFLMIMLLFAVVGAFLSLVLGLNFLLAPVVGLTTGALPLAWLLFVRKRRLKAFGEQLPEALELMARALRAGHSLAAGFQLVGHEMREPLGSEFSRVFEEQNFGVPLEEALTSMTDRVPNLDLKFFATAVVLQRQTGGDLAEILDKIGTLIRDRFKIYGQIQALTGEGRLSGIVLLGLPPFLFLVMLKLNYDYIMILFTDELGKKLMVVAVLLQLVGALVIRKIVNIKV